jgi:hypothetical protein
MPQDLPDPLARIRASYPLAAKTAFDHCRAVLFEEAERLGVGEIEETLKWGEPAYLTVQKAGSTIRMGWTATSPDQFNLYFICSTDLVGRISSEFPDAFTYSGNRCAAMPLDGPAPAIPLRAAVSMALTYHKDKALARN